MLQDYPPFTAPNGTVWVKDVEFDGKYLTYTERIDEWGFGVLVKLLDVYGNETRTRGGKVKEKVKEDGVWRIIERNKLRHKLKGEVVEIQFNKIYDGYSITWIYEVRDRGFFCFF